MGYEVCDLSCTRGNLTVLEGVSFTLDAGELLVLRGPNGTGKTTLLRCLAGLTPPAAGTVSFAPDDVAYAAHADGLKSQLTAAENLRFWARVHGCKDISPAVDALKLAQLLDRPAQFLSAGQKRRLSLARLTLTGRPLWALDEPTVSLDQENVARFADALRAHLSGGGSAIIATHIDLSIKATKELELSPFRSGPAVTSDPFLSESFS